MTVLGLKLVSGEIMFCDSCKQSVDSEKNYTEYPLYLFMIHNGDSIEEVKCEDCYHQPGPRAG